MYYPIPSYQYFSVSANFSRPGDSNVYAAGDSICNSTSSPAILSWTIANNNGQAFVLDSVSVMASTKATLLPFFKLWLGDTTFAATNDNAAFALTDAEALTIQFAIPITEQAYTANNAMISATGLQYLMRPAAGSKIIYGALQVDNAYVPGNTEIYYVYLKGYLL